MKGVHFPGSETRHPRSLQYPYRPIMQGQPVFGRFLAPKHILPSSAKSFVQVPRKRIRCPARRAIGCKEQASGLELGAELRHFLNLKQEQKVCETLLVSVVSQSESAVTAPTHIISNIIDIEPDDGILRPRRGRCPAGTTVRKLF